MKFSRMPLLAAVPAALLAGSMLSAPVAGAQSSLPTPEDLLGSASGSLDLGSLGGDDCGTEVVNPDNLEASGWFTPGDENKPSFAADADAPLGDGALALAQHDKGTSLYKKSGAPLSSLLTADGQVAMNYQFKSSGQAPALQIRVLGANVKGNSETETNGFATIVWSPAEGEAGKWTDAKASEAKNFWVTRPVLNKDNGEVWLERGKEASLKEIVEHLNGNGKAATVSEYGVQQTKENSATGVAVDQFVFGCETTDFEAAIEPGDDEDVPGGFLGSLQNPDVGSLALGGGLALAAALTVGGGAFAIQNGLIQLPPELAAMLPQQ